MLQDCWLLIYIATVQTERVTEYADTTEKSDWGRRLYQETLQVAFFPVESVGWWYLF